MLSTDKLEIQMVIKIWYVNLQNAKIIMFY